VLLTYFIKYDKRVVMVFLGKNLKFIFKGIAVIGKQSKENSEEQAIAVL
jgi:hypothetical protein